jgi:hypothetical protein
LTTPILPVVVLAQMRAKKLRRPGTRKKTPIRSGALKRTVSTKLAISFEDGLAVRVQRAARVETGGNVSAWLAEAARERLRLQAGRALLKEYESAHGAITADEIARVERQWPRD